ncbi:MAG: phytanoyl-CoA dioxygenase family protein [Planctomycetota bacterium]
MSATAATAATATATTAAAAAAETEQRVPNTGLVSADHLRRFREDGFFVLDAAIGAAHLAMLREECAAFIEKEHGEMDRLGVDQRGLNYRGKRYFISCRYAESARLADFIFSPLMAEICQATLGPEAFLFHEQYVVKAAEQGMKFSWHQDSGYVGHDHRPYLTTWCALDDMTEENGTVYMLPYERAGGKTRVEHWRDTDTTDLIGYGGDDPGVPVICPAGSIAVFSSTCFHRSGFNRTKNMRRVYLPQYSAEPIYAKDGSKLWRFAVPFIMDGRIVYRG